MKNEKLTINNAQFLTNKQLKQHSIVLSFKINFAKSQGILFRL